MKKIYLAISEKKEIEPLLAQFDNIPNSEVIHLEKLEEIEETLFSKPFFAMAISSEYLTDDRIQTQSIQGFVYILDKKGIFPSDTSKNIYSYTKIDAIINEIVVLQFQNNEIKKLKDASSTPSHEQPENKTNELEGLPDGNLQVQSNTSDSVPPSKKTVSMDNDNDKNETIQADKEVKKEKQGEPASYNTSNNDDLKEVGVSGGDKESYPSIEGKTSTENSSQNPPVEKDEYTLEYISKRNSEFMNDEILVKPDNNIRIGVWSPLHRTGVTSFILNFAIYLSNLHQFNIAVVENINNKPRLKSLLTRYKTQPHEWSSYAELFFNKNIPTLRSRWIYKNVAWYPLGDFDSKKEWNEKLLIFQFGNLKKVHLVFVDLPTGPMEPYTKDTLKYLDELWIMVDDSPDQLTEWKKIIQNDVLSQNLKAKLIFNRRCTSSKVEGISRLLDIPLLASIPNLNDDFVASQYSNKPLIEHLTAYQELLPSYRKLESYLLKQNRKNSIQPSSMVGKIKECYRWLIDIKLK